MKMYKKKKLAYKNGYIVKDGKVIAIDNEIVDLFNKLEEDYQRYLHEKNVNLVAPFATHYANKPFARATEHGKVFAHVEPKTPELDAAVEKAVKIMDEIDSIALAEKCNEYMKKMQPLFRFASSKRVLDCKQAVQHQFDLPKLGNPLELDAEAIATIIMMMFQ